MTKQEFLDGKWFKLGRHSHILYYFENRNSTITEGFKMGNGDITETQTLVTKVEKITPTRFIGYGYVMNKRVNINFKFEDLIL